jgi:hypothetical protein
MNQISAWFRQLGMAVSGGFRRFMAGRYGTDKLNMAILGIGLALSLVSLFVENDAVDLILTILSYGLLFWAVYRSFSRDTYKRYQENRKYLLMIDRIKDREHKHFECPRCRQVVRVPRGKGKIAITCPKCREKFIKKS